ncbi:cob(I)yrinic acid a,c-diamide adenosyltransferase [Pyrofollis japonicus]|uniref:ATP:cob(I)alamin adenosyltransferase n=1 Tax=Pyrofollis japonicus TaxID=3060460 RepID=UPI00295B1949|nr:ATP:cob(I)alamin adenosyltransferase [Pyrofollis japonicus]BEP16955.1 cob(I)yrinic acid a,c-diamide adenosyltransferase [Pyrofollis japonicus]
MSSKFKPVLGTGDDGYTYCIITRKRVPKTHSCIEFVGALDEAEASLGFAQSLLENLVPQLKEEVKILELAQVALFRIGFYLAGKQCLNNNIIEQIEKYIKKLSSEAGFSFVLNGGHPAAAATSLARTSIRRAERAFWRCINDANIRDNKIDVIAKLLNRLSDLAYLLQLRINRRTGRETSTIKCQ